MDKNKLNGQFEVLSPGAEIDPISLRGISPRLPNLDGKRIGLYCNPKRAARPMLGAVERKLKERFPTLEFTYYAASDKLSWLEVEAEKRVIFQEWVKGVDGVITAVGD
ncbi:MAG: hypothetical protein ABSH06_05540 [Thermodesulfobacteriota bacterium]